MGADDRMGLLIYATTLEALLSLDGDEFVQCCFQTLLHRWPTADEQTACQGLIQDDVSRMSLVVQLASAPEGLAIASKLPGLKSAVKRFKQSQIPLVGWLFRCSLVIQAQYRRLNLTGSRDDQLIRLTPRAQNILSQIEIEASRYEAQKGAG